MAERKRLNDWTDYRRLDPQQQRVNVSQDNIDRGSDMSATVTVKPLDGRTAVARRVRETKHAICNDLGGEERLSTLQIMLAEQVAGLSIFLEDEFRRIVQNGEPTGMYLPSINTLNRLCKTLGINRVPRSEDIDLNTYMKRFQKEDME
ncbi:hypothetical protein [Aquisalimonas asiatica]|uniref:Uncharacterized protein n=1 Tax=Aquisalimonas asiatica TaxID=406100 RepID=A0A1H8UEA7_9GAMM|nr:hypothetical protein [Aquisalimonas asiatica]SEP00958.1 hypothetical protein SAMN04488052_10699 [Aquisalimonas asiatica]